MVSIEFTKGTTSDYEEIVDFANYVFSHDYGNCDFPSKLPKLYSKEDDTTQCHYIAKSEGKILAMVALFPLKVNIFGKELKVASIGTVCVHPYYRGLGLMKSLMNSAMDDMKKEGAAFSVLSGQRQRYEYFGYEPCGTKLDFTVTSTNLRHFYKNRGVDDITFVPMEKNDAASIAKAHALQQSQPFYVIRESSEFYDICCSWDANPYIILKSGEFFGYIVCSQDKTYITELELSDISELPNMISSYLSYFELDTIYFSFAPYENEKIKIIEKFCDNLSINKSYSFNVFDYESTIRQLLQVKATYTKLCDGKMVLEIENRERLCIEVNSQKVSVTRTDASSDVVLTQLMALRFLFSPVSAFFDYAPQCRSCIASWLPLPIYWPFADGV